MKLLTGLSLILCATIVMSGCTRKRSHRVTEFPAQVETGSLHSTLDEEKTVLSVDKISPTKILDTSMSKIMIEQELLKQNDGDILDMLVTTPISIANIELQRQVLNQNRCLITIREKGGISDSILGDCDLDEDKFIEIIKSFKSTVQAKIDQDARQRIGELSAHEILSNLCIKKSETIMRSGEISLEVIEDSSQNKECHLILTNQDQREEIIGSLDDSCQLIEGIKKFKELLNPKLTQEYDAIVPDDNIDEIEGVKIELD